MHYKKISILTSILLITTFSLAKTQAVIADSKSNCQPIYGGGTTCIQSNNISINKKILNPQTGVIVDNLTDYKFAPGQLISFQITIKNISSNTLSNILVKDIFPIKYLNFYSGPGKFDNNTKTLTININNLNKDEEKDYTVRATVVSPLEIAKDQTICVSNEAQVINGSEISQSNSQFCIQSATTDTNNMPNITSSSTKGGLPIYRPQNSKRTPSTGPEDITIFGLLPIGAIGLFLRKKAKIYKS